MGPFRSVDWWADSKEMVPDSDWSALFPFDGDFVPMSTREMANAPDDVDHWELLLRHAVQCYCHGDPVSAYLAASFARFRPRSSPENEVERGHYDDGLYERMASACISFAKSLIRPWQCMRYGSDSEKVVQGPLTHETLHTTLVSREAQLQAKALGVKESEFYRAMKVRPVESGRSRHLETPQGYRFVLERESSWWIIRKVERS